MFPSFQREVRGLVFNTAIVTCSVPRSLSVYLLLSYPSSCKGFTLFVLV